MASVHRCVHGQPLCPVVASEDVLAAAPLPVGSTHLFSRTPTALPRARIESYGELPDAVEADVDALVMATRGRAEMTEARQRVITWLLQVSNKSVDEGDVAPNSDTVAPNTLRRAPGETER